MSDNVNSFYKQYMAKLEQKAREAIDRVMPKVWEDFFANADKSVRELFNETIDQFYSEYTPGYYDRTESLYELIQSETSPEYLKIWMDPDNMSSFRNGYSGEDGLYDLVFRRGWHGGADKGNVTRVHLPGNDEAIERSTPHPESGTPYWRVPDPYYTAWGRKAYRSDSPLEVLKLKLDDYNSGNNKGDYLDAWEKHVHEIRIDW